jgi:SnoaL-like domain
MTPDEMIAREGIRQTLANYTMASDTRDADLFVAQFAEGAVFEVTPFPGTTPFRQEGLEALRRWTVAWSKTTRFSPVYHNLTTSHITLTGKDTATARTYFTSFSGIGPDHAGVYIDALVRQGNRWLISHRQVAADWLSPNRPV